MGDATVNSQNTPSIPLDQPLVGASFGAAIRRFFAKYATFSGRAGSVSSKCGVVSCDCSVMERAGPPGAGLREDMLPSALPS